MEWLTAASQPSAIQLVALVLSAVVTVDVVRRFTRHRIERQGYSLPPGPTPFPLLGSALSVNAQEPWLTYTAWRAKYGDVMHVRLLDIDVIVLNSQSAAIELLEKRSQLYSDRPFIATVEPYGHGANFAFARYGPHWRLCRRIVHQTFRAEAALAFRPMQLRRARQIVINIIDDPSEYPFHFSTFASAMAMSSVYDYEPKPRDDPMVKLVNDFLDASFAGLSPEMAVLVKAFPFLLSVPEWIPGLSRVRREANKSYNLGIAAMETPYQWLQKRMEAKEDIVTDTMVFDHTQRMENLDSSCRAEYEKALKQTSLTIFLGATQTTSGTLMTFALAMVKNPRIWKRAQAEIDAVIGTDRLPEYEDRPSLPYVDAIVRESLRWQPVGPMGIPHAVVSDDIYKGYYIPRGTTVFANIWAMSRDESRYPDPDAFIPEKFLDSEGNLNLDNPADFVFGFGRRICPGRHTADASVWSGIVTMLATLDFNAAKDVNGNDIEFEAKFANGIAHHPVPFPCNITPRAHITRESLEQSLGT
ncbi:cytochrome P450 [Boletus edulis]|uniref:Cytochrome P450 n=1 Tax=Boletus edulis BED1 TaxID=1328754 RepID=A0AAD4GCX3_BOLED|nr:cytochrome P450 [Boletus edulis]KAF8437578.1 cytochrome P450 [Boletus edulis BED1]